MGRGPNWNDAEDDILDAWYGLETAEKISRRIKRATGRYRSAAAVALLARKLKIDHRTNQAGVTIADAARELGITLHTLCHQVTVGNVRTFGSGKVKFIDFDDLEQLRAKYPAPPARSTTVTKARKLLGYGETQMVRLIKGGVVRAVKRGERWYVDMDHVEQLARQMKTRGVVRLNHRDNPAMEAERAHNRDYCKRIRNIRRAQLNGGAA
jgi:hypothetical protein